MKRFLTEWYDADPDAFTKLCNARAREFFARNRTGIQQAVELMVSRFRQPGGRKTVENDDRPFDRMRESFRSNRQYIFDELMHNVAALENCYRIEPSFYERPANMVLLAALADLRAEVDHTPRFFSGTLLLETLAPLVVGRHGDTAESIKEAIEFILDVEFEDPDYPINTTAAQADVAKAGLLEPLGAIRCLQNQLVLLDNKSEVERLRDAARRMDRRALSVHTQKALLQDEALLTAASGAFAEHVKARLEHIDIFVVHDRALPSELPIVGVAGDGASDGFLLIRERTAGYIIASTHCEQVAPQLRGATAVVFDPAVLGLNGALNALPETQRVDEIEATLAGEGIWHSSDEHFLFDTFVQTLTGRFVGPVDERAGITNENSYVDEYMISLAKTVGFRLTLDAVLLMTYFEGRQLVSSPLTTMETFNERATAFVDALTQRVIEVDGWPKLVRRVEPFLDEQVSAGLDEEVLEELDVGTISRLMGAFETLLGDQERSGLRILHPASLHEPENHGLAPIEPNEDIVDLEPDPPALTIEREIVASSDNTRSSQPELW